MKKDSRLYDIYEGIKDGQDMIYERHRHRYEFNTAFADEFEDRGMELSGRSPDGRLVEAVELKEHPFYIGVQYHPEFKSRPQRPHPLFSSFIAAAKERRQLIEEEK